MPISVESLQLLAIADVKLILPAHVQLNQIPVVDKGMAVLFDEQAMSNTLTHENVTIDVQLGLGNAAATAYGCDLSYDYVRINASYRT